MTDRQKLLVQASFEKIEPIAETAGMMLYDRIFELDPSTRDLFRISIEDQGRKLMQVLEGAVKSLDRVESLIPMLEAMGRRHMDYGVTANHYRTVRKALIWTLEKAFGDAFTAEMREAWQAVYDLLADAMQRGAQKLAPTATMAFHASSH